MKSNLVTIGVYSDPLLAGIIKARLEDAGITCFLQNERIVSTAWLSSDAVGGLKLKVDIEDEERAKAILAEHFEIDDETEFIEETAEGSGVSVYCPACGSNSVTIISKPKWLSVVLSLIGLTKIKYIEKYSCNKCGHTWKKLS